MTNIEKEILENFRKTLPKLNDLGKERLLYYSEGIAAVVERQQERRAESA